MGVWRAEEQQMNSDVCVLQVLALVHHYDPAFVTLKSTLQC